MKQDEGSPTGGAAPGTEGIARRRLRSLRLAKGWTLDELARRAHIGASTISRIETGHRRLTIDHLADLARALDTTVDEMIAGQDEDDVVIRPTRSETYDGAIVWPLNRAGDPSGRSVAKLRVPASSTRPEPQVHPGREWFYVLEGTARLLLGDREHLVAAGQAAEFHTMTPHAFAGHGGPVELLMIVDRAGERAHLRPGAR